MEKTPRCPALGGERNRVDVAHIGLEELEDPFPGYELGIFGEKRLRQLADVGDSGNPDP